MKYLFNLQIILFMGLILCSGCTSVRVNTKPYSSGKVLLLPPRDLVQKGMPHEKGVGSGRYFQNSLQRCLSRTAFDLTTTENVAFSNTQIADVATGLKEANAVNADYCLQVVLGEFLNAAPMTFRSDYARLDRATMYDVGTGEVVWALVNPILLQKGNPGNHLCLLDTQARMVANSIVRNVQPTYTRPPRAAHTQNTSVQRSAAPVASSVPVATTASNINYKDIPAQLKMLKELRDSEVLTVEEYEGRRKILVEHL